MPDWHVLGRLRPAESLSKPPPTSSSVGARLRASVCALLVVAGVSIAALGAMSAEPWKSPPAGRLAALKYRPMETSMAPGVATAFAEHEARAGSEVSRSATRPPSAAMQRMTKSQALSTRRQTLRSAVTKTVAPPDPRTIAMSMLGNYGWTSDQFSCLDDLWTSESNWNPYSQNVSSGAYGIPQALPAQKMASAGSDWRTNPATQIRWGLQYIRSSYGSPCAAWYFKAANSWY